VGIFIAIEGGDGSGKHTQTNLLIEYAKTTLGKTFTPSRSRATVSSRRTTLTST